MNDDVSMPDVQMDELEAEQAVSLPNKEVLSLLDVNANVDLGLDLAAPVDLAAAANLNVAAPIEASAAANVLSAGSNAIGLADQHGTIDQAISGSATATAPQHAGIDQTSGTGGTTGTTGGTAGATGDTAVPATAGGGDTAVPATAGTGTTGGVDSLLNGGSLLDANINIHADANLTAPIDGAVAANANVAAPIDAAVGANVGSIGSTAEAVAPQTVDISQNLDQVSADATATQDANVSQG
jgi:hypothetical protein